MRPSMRSLLVPAVASAVVALLSEGHRQLVRWIGLVASLVTLGVAIALGVACCVGGAARLCARDVHLAHVHPPAA